MYCAYICCLLLCFGTTLAVLYNGEAPRQNAESVVGQLQQQHIQQQQQQRQNQQTLPGYQYTQPQTVTAATQPSFVGYRYTAPAAGITTTARPTTTTTTTTTTVRPIVTAAAAPAAPVGYIYNTPTHATESHNRHAFYPPPYYQQTYVAPGLAFDSDLNNAQQQRLPLSSAPSYYVPQSEAVANSGKTTSSFFVAHNDAVPQATQSPLTMQQSEKEQRKQEVPEHLSGSSGYSYVRPVSSIESTPESLTPYQRAFQEFADYLMWQRAQRKQQQQQQQQQQQPQQAPQTSIVTQEAQTTHEPKLSHFTQFAENGNAPQLSFPAAQNHFSLATSTQSSGSYSQVPQQATAAGNVALTYPQAAATPIANIFPQYAASFPNQAQAQPIEQRRPASNGALLSGERYVSIDNSADYLEMPSKSWELPSYTTTTFEMLAVPSNGQSLNADAAHANTAIGGQRGAVQQNGQYLYGPAKLFAQTTDQPHAQTSQVNAALFTQIPQWPQNVALQAQQQQQQIQQQQPIYSHVADPLSLAAHATAIGTQQPVAGALANQPQQPQRTEQLNVGAAQSTFARDSPYTQQSSSNSNSNAFHHLHTTPLRRPHNSYGLPSQNTAADGYNYQRSVA